MSGLAASEWLASILAEGRRIEGMERDLECIRAQVSPRCRGFEPMGRGGAGSDGMLAMAMLSERAGRIERMLPVLRAKHEARVSHARRVLYGASGTGGLAKALGTDDADVLDLHYLRGEGWASIARRFDPDTPHLTMWCRRKALRACREIDRIGAEVLASS